MVELAVTQFNQLSLFNWLIILVFEHRNIRVLCCSNEQFHPIEIIILVNIFLNYFYIRPMCPILELLFT